MFGRGELRDVPLSHAVAASSAIPGFFEPYPIASRDYVDGGVGFCGHADPAPTDTPLCGPCMGFEASRGALRFGYTSTRAWLDAHGTPLLGRVVAAVPQAA